MALYIEENREAGISIAELVEQFQEYDCEHFEIQIGTTAFKVTHLCTICGKISSTLKRGVTA
jgi:hypothetical protein